MAPGHGEFAREIRRVLRPGGLYALNLIDQGDLRLLRAEAATLLDVFADVRLVAHAADGEPLGGNVVFLASDRALAPAVALDARAARARSTARAVQRIAGDADVLRDDDAPADQLHQLAAERRGYFNATTKPPMSSSESTAGIA